MRCSFATCRSSQYKATGIPAQAAWMLHSVDMQFAACDACKQELGRFFNYSAAIQEDTNHGSRFCNLVSGDDANSTDLHR